MAKQSIAVTMIPTTVTLTLTADWYEINLDPASFYAPSHANAGRGTVRVKALGATTVKFAIGKDPSANPLSIAAADGWVDIAFQNGVNNLWAKGSADGAQFALTAF